MSTRTGKTALITGASAGLGNEYAKLFARDGHDVVLVARRRDRLAAAAAALEAEHGIKARAIEADLTDAAAPQAIFDELGRAGIRIDFLVNNAGLGSSGPFASSDVGRELGEVMVNVHALTHLTRLFLPAMLEARSGRVLNIGSTAAFVPGPYMATYYASKAYVVSFTRALAFELKNSGVTATVSCPGATATEFATVAGTDKSKLFASGVADAASVALHGYRAMHAGKTVAVPGLKNQLGVISARLAPSSLLAGIAAGLNRGE